MDFYIQIHPVAKNEVIKMVLPIVGVIVGAVLEGAYPLVSIKSILVGSVNYEKRR